MRAELKRRIAKLEAAVGPVATLEEGPESPGIDVEGFCRALMINLALEDYYGWRHEPLTLEERLAIARDDVAKEEANPHTTWAPGLWEIGEGQWVSISTTHAVREIEVRVLERDHKIDAATAATLRENAEQAHCPKELKAKRSSAPPLSPLPHAVEFDQAATLAAALARCPRVETMTPQQRLELEFQDYPHRRKEAEERWADMFERPLPPGVRRAVPLPGMHPSSVHEDHLERVRNLERAVAAQANPDVQS